MSAVEFSGVTLAVGGRRLLHEVDLAVRDAEFVGVLGPNGAGKTTLMRAILGLVTPVSGKIRVLGRPAVRGNPAIGYLPQVRSHIAPGRLSGWDLIASTVDGHRFGVPIPSAAARRDIAAALDRVGAGALARRPFAELSGGERQRLLLA
ncbi:MAG TPA: ATP-binding cassette domain-containing protein, partial [Steroidobacteraceae bacterium]|nr:ATP-binding cassette domain-containing protein [Steroidobacteraceae bacterium]